jgi:hypothetical protein
MTVASSKMDAVPVNGACGLNFRPVIGANAGDRGDAGESDVAGQALDVIFFRRRAGAMRGLAAGY